MHIEHVALWCADIEAQRVCCNLAFGATANARYESRTTAGFASYFLTFPDGGARLELMELPTLAGRPHPPALGYAHIAITVGSREAVDALVARLRGDGVHVRSEARLTGDGYYEAVIDDPDGNPVEVTE